MTPTQAALPQILTALAAALGDGWEREPTNEQTWCHKLTHPPTGMGLHVSTIDGARGKPARLSIRVAWPQDGKGRVFSPFRASEEYHITVAADRPAEKIAAELRRRLFPSYEVAFAKMKAALAHYLAGIANRDSIAAHLAALADRKPSEDGKIRLFDDSLQCRSGDLSVDFDGDVNIELRGLSEEHAAEILRLLRKP